VSENLDFVRSIVADWDRGDFSSADWADPEIDFVMRGGLQQGRWKGVDEMSEAWAVMLRAWDHLRAIPDGFREVDEDRVLVYLRNEGRGKGSGIEIGEFATPGANLFTVRGGKVTKLVVYWERAEAIADLGLEDEGDSQDA
jgi:hypothetical protein